LTVKAVNVLRRAHAIYHAGPQEDRGRAWDTVRGLVGPQQAVGLVRTGPMAEAGTGNGKESYRRGVERIAADCRRGLDVAFVTEGDPTLYSTATPVWQLLAEVAPEVPIEIVPGVSSITAAAARVGRPLARKEERLAVVPASYHAAELDALLTTFPNVCLLKANSALPQLVQSLERCGPGHEAFYVENVSTPQEWVTSDLPSAVGRREYFALVLVRRTHQPRPATGKLWVVGLGPGDPRLLSQQAREALRDADAIVGYEAYLKRLEPLRVRAEMHGSPIGAEAERATLALELAGAGRRVALVSSGDAGVYGMAGLLLETAAGRPDLDVEVVPGVTAATAAAALLGAPLGHDFACVSLSDLLTPWEVIERRLHAAGQGDFVLAVYNPLSERRTWQLPRARDVLLEYRRPETPVGLVDKAYRPGTRVWSTTLGELTPDGVGMETTLIVGSSRTRLVHGRLVTPRGYGERS
jgi:precorrin-2 C20-methyltransferase/precorrin-3B C17-methyltransferase